MFNDFLGPLSPAGTKPPFAQFYADEFNMVDLFNRRYYSLLYPHKQMSSGPVRIWSLLNLAFVQAYSYYCEARKIRPETLTLIDFTKQYVDLVFIDERK